MLDVAGKQRGYGKWRGRAASDLEDARIAYYHPLFPAWQVVEDVAICFTIVAVFGPASGEPGRRLGDGVFCRGTGSAGGRIEIKYEV